MFTTQKHFVWVTFSVTPSKDSIVHVSNLWWKLKPRKSELDVLSMCLNLSTFPSRKVFAPLTIHWRYESSTLKLHQRILKLQEALHINHVCGGPHQVTWWSETFFTFSHENARFLLTNFCLTIHNHSEWKFHRLIHQRQILHRVEMHEIWNCFWCTTT